MVDTGDMIKRENLASELDEEDKGVIDLAAEAEDFVRSHSWCNEIKQIFFDRGWGSTLGVFLFRIDGSRGADPEFWVIVGDLPPAYIVTDRAQNGAQALLAY